MTKKKTQQKQNKGTAVQVINDANQPAPKRANPICAFFVGSRKGYILP